MKPSTAKRKREEAVSDSTSRSIATTTQATSIKFSITEQFIIYFSNEADKNKFAQIVLDYLEEDYYDNDEPKIHFHHNRAIIEQGFKNGWGMVVLNAKKHFVGFMTWIPHSKVHLEINIVEVQNSYRRKGIFKHMLSGLMQKYPDTYILTAGAIPQSHLTFKKMGWIDTEPHAFNIKYFHKIVKQGLEPSNELTDGRVIAICPKDYYEVNADLSKYQPLMRYYKIDLAEDQALHRPILAEIEESRFGGPNNYIAVYYNKELVASGRPRYIFADYSYSRNTLIINNVIPVAEKEKTFLAKGFFANSHEKSTLSQPEPKRQKTLAIVAQSSNRYSSINNSNSSASETSDSDEEYSSCARKLP